MCKFSGRKHIHIVVQLSPLSSSRTFSSCKTKTLYPWDSNSPGPLPEPLASVILLSVSVHSTTRSQIRISGVLKYLFFRDWLASLSIRFIHVVAGVRIPCLVSVSLNRFWRASSEWSGVLGTSQAPNPASDQGSSERELVSELPCTLLPSLTGYLSRGVLTSHGERDLRGQGPSSPSSPPPPKKIINCSV